MQINSNEFSDTAIIVFAKAPQPGRVKTRLISEIGESNATHLHAALVENTLHSLFGNKMPDEQTPIVQLWCAPDISHEFFKTCQRRWPVSLHRQEGKDLGERMHHALDFALSHNKYAVIIGTDCPAIDTDLIKTAIHGLQQGYRVVLSPAMDGGYVLLGAGKVHENLFRDVAWGSSTVLQTTMERLNALGWSWQRLEECWDIDRPEDVHTLLRQLQTKPDSYLSRLLQNNEKVTLFTDYAGFLGDAVPNPL